MGVLKRLRGTQNQAVVHWLCHELAVISVSASGAAALYQVSTVYLGHTWELWTCQGPGRTPDQLNHHLWRAGPEHQHCSAFPR